MAEDILNLRLSKHASKVANNLKDEGVFEDALSAAKFGMSYAIKYCWDDMKKIEELDKLDSVYDANGNNYNVGSVDPDHYIFELMKLLYPGIDVPYRYVRVLMCYGLNIIGDLVEENKFFPVSKNM